MKNIDIKKIGRLAVIVIAGIAIGWFIKPSQPSAENHSLESHEGEEVWTCSMHPQIRQSEPGKCPLCGMDLIPVSGLETDDQQVVLSENAIRLANIQTMKVSSKDPVKELNLFGKVKPDERMLHSQTSHLKGRIEELRVNFTGESVRKNQVLAYIYSPDLVTTQEELIETYKIREEQPELYNAARERLINWKLTNEQIDNIIKEGSHIDRFPVLSDVNGIVIRKMVSNGDHVMAGQPLYEVANLSTVWVQLDVYEKDLPWVKKGNEVNISVESLPGEIFEGEVSFVDPVINPATRVANARVELKNEGLRLKPEMLVTGKISASLENASGELIIPKSAVMWTGERSIVYVRQQAQNGTAFALREVNIGPAVGDGFIIREGLEEGEEIAINGTFAIDAAAQLEGKPSMMSPFSSSVNYVPEGTGVAVSAPSFTIESDSRKVIFSLLENYLLMKDQLVLGNLNEAKSHLADVKKIIESNTEISKIEEANSFWIEFKSKTTSILDEMAKETDLENFRLAFKPLSAEIINLAEAFGPYEKTIFVQHCPMADGYNGADWISTEEEIKNPYFGDAMLTCGSVTKVISKQ